MPTLSTARGRSALAVSIAFTCLATVFFAIRMYTRAVMAKQTGIDDYTLLVALAFSWAFFALFVGGQYCSIGVLLDFLNVPVRTGLTSSTEAYHGMGAHFDTVPHGIYVTQMLCFWASIPTYQASLISTKMSILLQYHRVFSTTPRMRMACVILIGFLAIYGTWTFISAWLTCVPIAKFWDPTTPGFCFDKEGLWFSNSAIHITTDLLILLYPMPVLKSLQLPKKQKIALMGVFALGAFVMITSILRLKSLLVISNSTDPTYDNVGAATWSAVECNVAIICACLPSTRALLSKLLPHLFSSHNGQRSKTTLPDRFGRSGTTKTQTQIQASVVGGRDFDYDMDDLSHSGSWESPAKEQDHGFSGIRVTTAVRRESVTQLVQDETGSTKDLVI
ncbi:hypothetical protein N7468_007101 [Penicillium chermesinum]|uniref:Rhodopsin domain-containing protein n=1 Tax=Penicillium chermesinum TaxID=63820 RepID=A0A9W9TK82_9EURO|nr:uncharacterized protein N7468_007101 [Penicillium chermesinum]KAJ5225876.1 hypothetical protein N7468_007101 [Penicillium chermesinum]